MICLSISFFCSLLSFRHSRHVHAQNPVCRAVTIEGITVPPKYELRENAEPLILDCDFTVNANETGFVLKWLHNSVSIYQWIPSKKVPFALVNI